MNAVSLPPLALPGTAPTLPTHLGSVHLVIARRVEHKLLRPRNGIYSNMLTKQNSTTKTGCPEECAVMVLDSIASYISNDFVRNWQPHQI